MRARKPIPPPRASRRHAPLAVLALTLAAAVASTLPSQAATGSTVVSATVPSATNIATTDCLPGVPNRTDFGSVLPGATARTTIPCSVTFGSSNDQAMLRIAQRDGVGRAMWRTTNGALDTAGWAAPNGYVDPPELSEVDGGFVQSDGKLVVYGRSGGWPNYHPTIMRYDDTGTPDGTFSGDGVHQLTLGAGAEYQAFYGATEQPDGKIVAVGARYVGADYEFLIARYLANGSLDTAGFGAPNGYVALSPPDPDPDSANFVAIESDGDIVVGGSGGAPGFAHLQFTRVSSTGVQDTAGFGAPDGWAQFDDGPVAYIGGMALQPDGKILFTTQENTVGRLNADGSLDTAGFNAPNGYANLPAGGQSRSIDDLDLLPDGSFLISGSRYVGGTSQEAMLWKYLPTGLPATATWGAPNGFVSQSLGTYDWWGGHHYQGTVVSDDGNVYSSGRAFLSGDYRPTITARNATTGAIDTAFGDTSGVRVLDTELPTGMFGGDLMLMRDGALATVGSGMVMRHGGERLLDYGGGTTWGAGANMFGACLVDAANGATTDGSTWAEDSADSDCADGDGDPWRAIPTSVNDVNAKVAEATALSQVGRADLLFGVRMSTSQAPGRYVAPITFDVVAPAT